MKKSLFSIVLSLTTLGLILAGLVQQGQQGQAAPNTVGVPASPLSEANDFAFHSMGNAWDMGEFIDISQYLNGAGRHVSLQNISVQNGLFSATSIGDYTSQLASFFLLFPGLPPNFMQLGNNLGSQHPIDTSLYQCLYLSTKVNSPTWYQGGPQPDAHRVMWYADKTLSPMGAYPNGGMSDWTYPESVGPGAVPMTQKWKLFKIDLNNPPGAMGVRWGDRATWPGIEIQPTIYANIDFSTDWVRLTSCQDNPAYQANITWTPDSAVTAVWLRSQGTTRDILVATSVNGAAGAYTLDTKGLPPGAYQVGVGTINNCCSQWSSGYLTINTTPLLTFDRPSPLSGEDYAESAGNAWDMEPSDVTRVECSSWAFNNGILSIDTVPPAQMPAECRGAEIGESDPKVFLNMPDTLMVGGAYRYLSFRMRIDGSIPLPADGMIARWMWTTTNYCTRVSADIGYDVGWHTYVIDLHDPFNGLPVAAAPDGCTIKHWADVGQLIALRIDPNENYTGILVQPPFTFHQEYDWIRLTKVDSVAQGDIFPIEGTLNKNVSALTSLNLYYTTDRNHPTQHLIGAYTPAALAADTLPASPNGFAAPAANATVYLPLIIKNYTYYPPLAANQFRHLWKTNGVPVGEYYICARSNDGKNSATDCSTAPLKVVSP